MHLFPHDLNPMGHSNLVSQSSPFILQEPSLHCLADLIPFPFRIARQLIFFLFLHCDWLQLRKEKTKY